MATKRRPVTKPATKKPAARRSVVQSELPIDQRVADVIAALKRHATPKAHEGMARHDTPDDHALGVSVGTLQS